MSEYQHIEFRAIDRPLTDKQLAYMDRQSSRADFNKWEYSVDYDYGSFGGDIDGMLRNGYDIFLNYTNYGNREIRISFPDGLPIPKDILRQFTEHEAIDWTTVKGSKQCILSIHPLIEDCPEDLYEFDSVLEAVEELRAKLMAGDIRFLYALWLCVATYDSDPWDELTEPPVPHGLAAIQDDMEDLFEFFDADLRMLEAASEGIPDAVDRDSEKDNAIDQWIGTLKLDRRGEIIKRLLQEDASGLKSELLGEVQGNRPASVWPCVPPSRTVANLLNRCNELEEEEQTKSKKALDAKTKREAKKAEKDREAQLATIKSNPKTWFTKVAKLVDLRTVPDYKEAASLLQDIQEAIGGTAGQTKVRAYVSKLLEANPTRNALKSELKKAGLLS